MSWHGCWAGVGDTHMRTGSAPCPPSGMPSTRGQRWTSRGPVTFCVRTVSRGHRCVRTPLAGPAVGDSAHAMNWHHSGGVPALRLVGAPPSASASTRRASMPVDTSLVRRCPHWHGQEQQTVGHCPGSHWLVTSCAPGHQTVVVANLALSRCQCQCSEGWALRLMWAKSCCRSTDRHCRRHSG